ncbi:hypothetical protein EPO33_02695 [Patescibacteria group bacterium]|nr:MAG: hypothetical protein EPO33_02695 [Patescibacteria group bacterium]
MLVKPKRTLSLFRINRRFLLNHPGSLVRYPLVRKAFPHSMLSYTALCQMSDVVEAVERNGIEGDIAELGCWKGGCGAVMGKILDTLASKKRVWLFDSFEGLPEPTKEDASWKGAEKGDYAVTEEDVFAALTAVGADRRRFEVIRGWFQDSVPGVKERMGKLSVLHLDGDTYGSTKCCLEMLYDSVSPGGYIVFDDYHLEGCRKAIYEFFSSREMSPLLRWYQDGGRVFLVK